MTPVNICKGMAVLLLCLSCCIAGARNNDSLAVSLIDSALLKDAHVVIRSSSTDVRVRSLGEVVTRRLLTVTILDKKGSAFEDFIQESSRISQVRNVEGKVYDKDGKQLLSLGKKDFQERGKMESYTAYGDVKEIYYYVPQLTYPFTVQYEWDEVCNYSFSLPGWHPVPGTNISVEKASFSIACPVGMEINIKAVHLPGGEQSSTTDKEKIREWTLQNYQAVKAEPLCFPGDLGIPALYLSAKQFQLEDYKGSAGSWKEMGDFFYLVNKDKDDLSDEAVEEVRALTKNDPTDLDKARRLYRYLQDHTRYIVLQYGIGGWQSLNASFVHDKKYGDCKALSNYMRSLLGAAGITAYPVLIDAGEKGARLNDPGDYVGNLFNHEILCIPSAQDTFFLECTSNSTPFGYLGPFTQNRKGLMITPEGGVMVQTPSYDTAFNTTSQNVEVTVGNDAKTQLRYHNRHRGMFFASVRNMTAGLPDDKLKDYCNSKLQLPSYETIEYHVLYPEEGTLPVCEEQFSVAATGLVKRAGNYMNLKTGYSNLLFSKPEPCASRKMPFRIVNSQSYRDTVVIRPGDGYKMEQAYPAVSWKHPFGSYQASAEEKDGILYIYRSLVLQEGVYQPALYADFVAFYGQVNKDQNRELLLRKQ